MLAGEERVAVAADLDAQIRFCGAGLPCSATGSTMHGGLHVLWMNFRLHYSLVARDDTNFLSTLFIIRRELYLAFGESENGVVAAHPHVHARVDSRSALPHDDSPSQNQFSVEALHTQPLGLRITPIFRTTAALLVCHPAYSPLSIFLVLARLAGFASAADASPAASDGLGAFRVRVARRAVVGASSIVASVAASDGTPSIIAPGSARTASSLLFVVVRRRGLRAGFSSVCVARRPPVRICRTATRVYAWRCPFRRR